jgi:hypothetical protein
MKIAIFLSSCLVLTAVIWMWWGPLTFVGAVDRLLISRQKAILYFLNHDALSQVVRDYAWPKNSESGYIRFGESIFERGDSHVPPALWIANPARIIIRKDRVDFEYGGALMHYGISIFPPHEEGSGTIKLGDGIWFYSENGRYPSKL